MSGKAEVLTYVCLIPKSLASESYKKCVNIAREDEAEGQQSAGVLSECSICWDSGCTLRAFRLRFKAGTFMIFIEHIDLENTGTCI